MLTIVITGSTKGIGFALAKKYLENGHQVVINSTQQKNMDEAVNQLSAYKHNLLTIKKDVREPDFGESVFALALQQFKKIDIWINNAGIPQDYRYLKDLSFPEIAQILNVNLIATIQITQQVYTLMEKQGFGRIYAMEGFGSDGRKGNKMGMYGTSKIALSYFTESFAKEVADSKVIVGRLSPGMVATDFLNLPYQTANEQEKVSIRKIYNLLGSDAASVADFFYQALQKPAQQNSHIRYLTAWRMIKKLTRAIFAPVNYFQTS